MASKTGEPDYVTSGLDANASADAGAYLERQADAAKHAETAPPTEPTEKKEVADIEVEKKEKEEGLTEAPEEKKIEDSEEKKTEEPSAAPVPSATTTADAPGPEPTPATSTPPSEPTWPETPADHPLTQFFDSITTLTTEAEHNEVYGLTLSPETPFHTKLILQKYLRANANDLAKAKAQLLETLKWRKTFEPIKAVGETFDAERFDGLGYIIELEGVPGSLNEKDVVTFNIYGAVKDNKKTFGDVESFLRWRVALMERSIQRLNLAAATNPIPDFGQGPDPYQGIQVHDYLQVSFLRMDPDIRAASKKTIEVLGAHYPETLSRKFFVNVPIIMGWLFAARKLIVAPETAKKFNMLSYGNQLLPELGPQIPKVYGGTGGELSGVGEKLKVE